MATRIKDIYTLSNKEVMGLLNDKTYDLKDGLQPLYDRIGNARIVLLGEASHGTHEYYVWRARITRYLIEEKDFNIIGVEGDWPDCYQINRYIRSYNNSGELASEVLKRFDRWPTWMWANWEIAALMEWLRVFNKGKDYAAQAGFYGLDVYSLWESLEVIREYLKQNDPMAYNDLQEAIKCFDPYNREGSDYAISTRFAPKTCENEVLQLLKTIRQNVPLYDSDPEGPFNTEQNALTAVNAEKYYRAMISGGPKSWNIRDEHMTQTLERLLDFHGPKSKAIVWEHNTHIGDARATDMKDSGLFNVGQRVREKWGTDDSVAVGFGSYKGSVIAGEAWDAPMKKMKVPEARSDSWEYLLHQASSMDKLIISQDLNEIEPLHQPMNHRAIGVVYNPNTDYFGNYVPSVMPDRYDAFIYLDKTTALHPIDTKTDLQSTPETYPWGV